MMKHDYVKWSSYTSCVARSGNLICVQTGQSAYGLFKTLYADWPIWTQFGRCVTAP